MAISIRCPECKSDNGKTEKKCKKCGHAFRGDKRVRYKVQVWRKGHRVGKSKMVMTMDEAIDLEMTRKSDIIRKVDIGVPDGAPLLGTVWEKLHGYQQDDTRDEYKASWPKDGQRWKDFVAKPFAKRPMDMITSADIKKKIIDVMRVAEHSKGTGYAPSTIEHVVKIIARIYNWSKRQNIYTGHNPTYEISIRYDNERDEPLTLLQCGKLLEVCDVKEYGERWPEAAAIVKIAVLTGRRRGEICRMKWEHVNWQTSVYRNKKTKSGDDVALVMPDDVIALLQSIGPKDEGDIFLNSMGNSYYHSLSVRWEEIKKLAGLPKKIWLHDLRHSFATAYASARKGGDIYRLQKLMGHKTLQMTQRYVHLFDAALEDDANVVPDMIKEAMLEAALDGVEDNAERQRIINRQDYDDAVEKINALAIPAAKKEALIAKADLARELADAVIE